LLEHRLQKLARAVGLGALTLADIGHDINIAFDWSALPGSPENRYRLPQVPDSTWNLD